jgi:hypothetical protein
MRDTLQAAYAGRPSEPFARPAGYRESLVQVAPPTPEPRVNATGLRPATSLQAVITGATAGTGAVNVQGKASGAYRLELGAGTSPGSWRTIAQGNGPVSGTLGVLPTEGLSAGLYSVRVVVQEAGNSVASRPLTISLRR